VVASAESTSRRRVSPQQRPANPPPCLWCTVSPPLHEWLDGDAERLAWALRSVLALAEAAPTVGWKGDMRHLPLVGHLPTRYLVAKQDNNGDMFLI